CSKSDSLAEIDRLLIHTSGLTPLPDHLTTPVQLIHRQIDNENNRKIMPKCIYLRNRKESKSRQCGPRAGRRRSSRVASTLEFGRLDHIWIIGEERIPFGAANPRSIC